MSNSTEWKLQMAVMAMQSGLAAMSAEDPDATLPHIEADIDALLRSVIVKIQDAQDMTNAAKTRAEDASARAKRFQARADRYRGLILTAFDALDWKKREYPEATVSLRAGSPGVVITNESALAPEYVCTTTAPDKAAIKADLVAGVVIEGAELANGMPSISIRNG